MLNVSLEPTQATHSTTDCPSRKMHFHILVVAILVDIAVTEPLTRTSNRRANNHIVNYKTATHSRFETGRPGHAVEGSYSYIGTDGRLYKVTYQADERGFRAQGAHLPWSAPVYNTIRPLNVDNVEVVQIIPAVPKETQKEENILMTEATKPEVTQENIKTEGQVNKEGSNALETIVNLNTTKKMEENKEDIVVEGFKEEVQSSAIIPGMFSTEVDLAKDENVVMAEEQSPISGIEATEKLTIHVPLIAKVYSLQKTTKPDGKLRETNGKKSRIIRYKLAYQPSWRNGENVLIPI